MASKHGPRMALSLVVASLSLAGCGGSDDGGQPPPPVATAPQKLQNRATCEALQSTQIAASTLGEPSSGAVVTSATYVLATPDTVNAAGTAVVQGTPDFCLALIDVKPVDATAPVIKAEVNLPTTWNNKSMQYGGGGFNGTLVTGLTGANNAPPSAPLPIARGYMTLGTDSGHQVANNVEAQAFALNAEALTNFAYASYKKTHDVGIALANAYYGRTATKSYWVGQSEGGREAMTMAQRYPADYDAILAVDPVMNWTGLQIAGNDVGGTKQAPPGAWLGGKVQLIQDTVMNACDGLDGIVDKVASNYRGCKAAADPAIAALRCPSGGDTGPTCLSDLQIAAVNAAHAGYQFSFARVNGLTSYAGFGYGSEGVPGNWTTWMTGTVPPTFTAAPNVAGLGFLFSFGNATIRYFFAQNKDFNPLSFDPTVYQARIVQVSNIMDATNPDLTAFFARGGKLILREDLSDTAQSPFTGLNYYDAVTARLGAAAVAASFRAYVSPGLPHTSGGIPGGAPNAPSYGIPGLVDWVPIIEDWSERGIAPPSQVNASLMGALPPYNVTATKPLCPYPTYARYVGTSPAGGNLAQNFQCTAS